MKNFLRGVLLVAFFDPLSCIAADSDAVIDFNRDIRPIISEKCVHCHGPDEETRAADLRLDTQGGSRVDLGGYAAIVPKNPQQSELIDRVFSDDADVLMPPPESKRELSMEEKELLRAWIEQGGKYDEHWAFAPPTRPQDLDDAIDELVSRQLENAGLKHSVEADRRTLIRRVSLDLIGLPPTTQQVAAFVSDDSPGAYETLVDELLTSERFGERWARPWLDLARYADSNGFQADQLRDSWAYRDWVIDALNRDMPFDQFTIEQIAGDLLPDATLAQKIATGFNRTVTCNVEAGVHPEENRVNQVVDRVNATATTWLGMTIECAQCHDHKYDPVTQKEYYQLFSIFNNTPLEVENPSGKGVQFSFWGPKMELPLEGDDAARQHELQTRLDALKVERDSLLIRQQRLEWETQLVAALENPPQWKVLEIDSVKTEGGEEVKILEDQSVLFSGTLPDKAFYEITCETSLDRIVGFKLEALTHPDLPGNGPGRGDAQRTNFILSEFAVDARSLSGEQDWKLVGLQSAKADFSQSDWDVSKAIDGDRKTGWAIAPQFGKSHWAEFLTEDRVDVSGGTKLKFRIDQNYGRGRTLGRIRLSALVGDAAALDVPEEVISAVNKPEDMRSEQEIDAVQNFYTESNSAARKLNAEIQEITRQLDDLAPATTLVMVEMDQQRETRVMKRGSYLSPGDKVEPGTPASLHRWDSALPRNRLGFAKWIVDAENPLTARVTVNRWWAELFGHGIVATSEDFGTQSSPPTHPELLDWLAVELVDSGWSMKHMLKLMVMSRTYRQDSRVTPDLLAADPENKLYARGPRFRMSAEMIRDNALAVSGLLSTKMTGQPVMPYQPDGLWKQAGRNEPIWVSATDNDRYRRGVYVVWRRAAPYPSFVNFDAPDRASCTVRRPRTNTPLQALTLMNDPAYVEMALALAIRIMNETPTADPDERLRHAFEIVLARHPSEIEQNRLKALFDERLAHLRANPDDVIAIIQGHAFPISPPEDLPAEELAAWFYIANTLLNLDETITKG